MHPSKFSINSSVIATSSDWFGSLLNPSTLSLCCGVLVISSQPRFCKGCNSTLNSWVIHVLRSPGSFYALCTSKLASSGTFFSLSISSIWISMVHNTRFSSCCLNKLHIQIIKTKYFNIILYLDKRNLTYLQ